MNLIWKRITNPTSYAQLSSKSSINQDTKTTNIAACGYDSILSILWSNYPMVAIVLVWTKLSPAPNNFAMPKSLTWQARHLASSHNAPLDLNTHCGGCITVYKIYFDEHGDFQNSQKLVETWLCMYDTIQIFCQLKTSYFDTTVRFLNFSKS